MVACPDTEANVSYQLMVLSKEYQFLHQRASYAFSPESLSYRYSQFAVMPDSSAVKAAYLGDGNNLAVYDSQNHKPVGIIAHFLYIQLPALQLNLTHLSQTEDYQFRRQ